MTLTDVQTQLTAWEAALLAVSKGQTASMGGRSLTRANLPEIRATITWLERKEKALLNKADGRSGLGASVARFHD